VLVIRWACKLREPKPFFFNDSQVITKHITPKLPDITGQFCVSNKEKAVNKIFHKIISAFAVLTFMLGSANYVGASSVRGATTTAPAFPGAEGFGENTVGGRGGIIYEVTNLNDAGAGSLRACIEASGARTCVFRTGGLIVLQSPLRIVNPYITIAGQTAPGGGITLTKASGGDVFSTQTHDVIIRYISARPGPGGENHANQIAKNGVELYNIIIDHNSLSWGVDSNIETWYRVREATIQWSIISEGLNDSTHSKGPHSKGLMIGGYKGSESGGKGSENISVLNNLMAHNAERNPLMQLCGIAQVINNTTYNPQWTFSHQQLNCTLGESYVNWINNYHKKGPSSTSNSDLKVIPTDDGTWSLGKVYVKGNIGPNRPNDTLPESKWVEVKPGAPAGVIVSSPAPAPAVNSSTAIDAYNNVLADGGAGNSRGLDCNGNWYNRRDSIDARVVNEVKTGTGKIIDDPSQVGGWIVPAAGVPCVDTDHDGMPNTWEQMYGFNPNTPDGSADKDGDGYTNVEEYFNATNPLDTIPVIIYPTVTGITIASSNAGNANFTVTFSKSVTGVDTGDFTLTTTGVSGAAVSGVSGSGSIYSVAVNTGIWEGTIRLDVVDDNSIKDSSANPLGGVLMSDGNFNAGEVYTVMAPSVFADVPASYWANGFIERLYNSGITSGCSTNPFNYCPDSPVTRAQMAVFLVRALHGAAFVPPSATGIFADVPAGSFGANHIEQLYADGITSGCGGNNYCPNDVVTRSQMAIFLVRARHGTAFVPPTATGIFTDVPVGAFGANHIEQLVADAITSGCATGLYCPDAQVKRDQMAVFLVKTFNLP